MSEPDTPSRSSFHFEWKPLDQRKNEFRVLELVSFDKNSRLLQTRLYHTPINTRLSYTALSYCWGNGPMDVFLLLDDFQLMITRHLHEALMVLFRDGIRHLWVDALCIDQQNLDEKSSQVLRMATIFKQAASVAIWLGIRNEHSTEVLRTLRLAAGEDRLDQSWTGNFRTRNLRGEVFWSDMFLDFLHLDYWHRLWVVQEIAVAAQIRVFWGDTYINGSICEVLFSKALWGSVFRNDLSQNHPPLSNHLDSVADRTAWNIAISLQELSPINYFKKFENVHKLGIMQFKHLMSLWEIRKQRRSRVPMSLLELLYDMRECKVTDRLDRVYGIVGLAFDHDCFISEPDYGLSNTGFCSAMTVTFIRSTGSLDVILLALTIPHSEPRLKKIVATEYPSWCTPFLHFESGSKPEYMLFEGRWERYVEYIHYLDGRGSKFRNGHIRSRWTATPGSEATNYGPEIYDGRLDTLGLKLGAVNFASPPTKAPSSDLARRLRIFDAINRLAFAYSPLYNKPELSRRVLKHSYHSLDPSVRHLRIPGTEYSVSEVFCNEEREGNICIKGESVTSNQEGQQLLDEVVQLSQGIRAFLLRFLCLGDGCFGYTEDYWDQCKDDFEIWLLAGCTMPVVLERRFHVPTPTDRTETFPRFWLKDTAIIDSAIVGGIARNVMNGEAWNTAPEEAFIRIQLV